jgi:23S rRNA (cytosine1962-C5)-methyltransferase
LEKKFAKGHPWVFSNDLDQSPKGIRPGQFIELRDGQNGFLAFGYGNPSTLISFRVLSRTAVSSIEELLQNKVQAAAKVRAASGVDLFSHRMIFGEADGLPGLIVDRYLVGGSEDVAQVFVIQSSTAGGDELLPSLIAVLRDESSPVFGEAFGGRGLKLKRLIVAAQDSSARAMEGLEKKPRELIGDWQGYDAHRLTILVQGGESARSEEGAGVVLGPALYDVDFIDGQKTGFFLDQRLNVRLAWPLIVQAAKRAASRSQPLRVLDLFSYVGQWSVQIARASSAAAHRTAPEITMADASTLALEYAAANVARAGATPRATKMDILNGIGQLPVGGYDVVICDPPAFIKKKKDIPTGRAAYVKLNREAMKRVAPGGVFVSCSCSGLLTDEEFVDVLADARRLSGREITWVSHGGHGEDHPYLSEFPQGRYLKGWVGVVL